MIRLTGANKLQVVLGGAATASRVTVSYMDFTATSATGGTQLSATNGATPIDICDAPAAATTRQVDHIKLVAKAAMTATFSVNDGTARDWEIVTLASGDVFDWSHSGGARVFDANGALKYSLPGFVAASGKTLTVSNTLTLAGTDGVTITFPATDATLARTDAAQTFASDQTFSGDIALNGGDLTTTATTFNLLAANATTVNAFGAASVALNIGHASAAAVFLGGVTVASGKVLTLTGATITGPGVFSDKVSAGLRNEFMSTDRVSVTSATTIYTQTLSGSSVGAPANLFLINGYLISSATTSFSDLVLFVNGQTPTVIGAVNRAGPDARTYTASSGELKLAMAGSTNYNVAVTSLEQAC